MKKFQEIIKQNSVRDYIKTTPIWIGFAINKLIMVF